MIFIRAQLSELLAPFAITLGVTSFILMMGKIYNIIQLMVEENLDFAEGAVMFLYLVPQSITLMLPIGVVGAVLITVIRQSTDAEVIALRAVGQGLWQYAWPVIFFGIICTGLTAIMTIWIQPATNRGFLDFQVEMIRAHAEHSLIPGELNHEFGEKVIRIGEHLPDGRVRRVFLADRTLARGSPIVTAAEGRIIVDREAHSVIFRLENGEMVSQGETADFFHATLFNTLDYTLELSGPQEINTKEVELRWSQPTSGLIRQLEALPAGNRERNRVEVELYSRLSNPLACLGFALIALPLGITNPRFRKTGGFLKGVLLILAYYVAWVGSRNLVLSQSVGIWLLWALPLLMSAFGMWLLWNINRHPG